MIWRRRKRKRKVRVFFVFLHRRRRENPEKRRNEKKKKKEKNYFHHSPSFLHTSQSMQLESTKKAPGAFSGLRTRWSLGREEAVATWAAASEGLE